MFAWLAGKCGYVLKSRQDYDVGMLAARGHGVRAGVEIGRKQVLDYARDSLSSAKFAEFDIRFSGGNMLIPAVRKFERVESG